MLFTDLIFLCLLSVTFLFYYIPFFPRFQTLILIISSLIFYAYNQPILVLLLLFSVSINIVSSYFIVYGKIEYRKLFAVLGVALNLSILVFFKYSPLLSRTFLNPSSSVGQFLVNMPLPIGISFFTFQGISLVVDVFREKHFKNIDIIPVSFVKHAERIMFFKGFFPQLISGPIVKAHDFLPQIGPKKFGEIQWDAVCKKLILGYFFKMVVADNLGTFTFYMFYPYFKGAASINMLFWLIGYSCQIFADFAGYSSIAIGLAKLFGYNFKENFNFPYVSTSFKEFWKRWHISLSSFLMEYLYIPLGGNKKGKIRTYLNLMLVMLLGGLWHGAAWSYALWGIIHGLALSIERALSFIKLKETRLVLAIKGMIVFFTVTLCWLFFKLTNFSQAMEFLGQFVKNISHSPNTDSIVYILIYASPIFIYHLFYIGGEKFHSIARRFGYFFYGLMLFLIVFNSGFPGSFIYFQF